MSNARTASEGSANATNVTLTTFTLPSLDFDISNPPGFLDFGSGKFALGFGLVFIVLGIIAVVYVVRGRNEQPAAEEHQAVIPIPVGVDKSSYKKSKRSGKRKSSGTGNAGRRRSRLKSSKSRTSSVSSRKRPSLEPKRKRSSVKSHRSSR